MIDRRMDARSDPMDASDARKVLLPALSPAEIEVQETLCT